MYPDSPPLAPASLVELFLARFQFGVEVEHWTYNNTIGERRCTGETNQVDCSGAGVLCSNYALQQKKINQHLWCMASPNLADECFAAPRPVWMQEHFGADPWTGSMLMGTGISRDQANATPGASKWHGARQGRDGWGDGGHIAWKWYLNTIHGPGASIEAMGTHAGVGYSQFLDNQDTYYAILPWLAIENFFVPQPQPLESDMQVFICPNKPVDKDGNTPHAEFWPAGSNPFLPNGGFLLHWGASLNGDQGKKNPNDPKQRVMVPQGGGKWIGAAARGTSGLMVVNDVGHTSGDGSLGWS